MKQSILDQVKCIHFAGIDGSGMCPLAEIFHHEGFKLTGSDMNESDMLDRVRSYGIPASMGHKVENTNDAQLSAYTAAVEHGNPELMATEGRGIPVVERSVMLGVVTCRYENSIVVPDTHSKTTAAVMITQVCTDDSVDPSAIIGGKPPAINRNGRVGKSQTIICEAYEYVDTFLQLTPMISVILNIDTDHLNYFDTLENITKPFHQFSSQASHLLMISDDDPNYHKAVEGIQNARIATFGINPDSDYAASGISDLPKACGSFSVYERGEKLFDVTPSVPGKHNIVNTLVTVAVSDYLGIDPKTTAEGLNRSTGIHRCFEMSGKFDSVTAADDLTYHPTELTTMLTAASRVGFHVVWALFQPHTYPRTYLLLDDFTKALPIPEHVVLSPILAMHETNTYHIHSKDLAEKVPGSVCPSSSEKMTSYAMLHAQPGDLILMLGGSDIYKCVNLIAEEYQKKDLLLKV